jgi:hypothetical protein
MLDLPKEPTPFWSEDPQIIFKKDELLSFFPVAQQTDKENLNALTRLGLYISLLLSVYQSSFQPFKYLFYVLIGTFAIYYFTKDQAPQIPTDMQQVFDPQNASVVKEELENVDGKCVGPSESNPFMNVSYVDYLDNPDRLPACDVQSADVKKDMHKHFSHNLYRNVNDLFGKRNSERQFYTMPSTTIPNRQDEFARWLYLSPKTCKEDQDYCLRYEDLRQKRPVLSNPNENPVNTERNS